MPTSITRANTNYTVNKNVLYGWGINIVGLQGQFKATTPVNLTLSPENWNQISGGSNHYGGIKTDNTLWNWGGNAFGQLGDGTSIDRSSPVQTIAGGNNWKQISKAKSGFYTAAIKTDGTLWTWGRNSYGALGDGTSINRSSPVQTIAGGTDWKQVSAGLNTCAAVKDGGTLWLWGDNQLGQLGQNSTTATFRSSPVQTIAGGTNWSSVSVSQYQVAAIKTDGTLWMWGSNAFGVLGTGDQSGGRSSPIQTISATTNWSSVDCSTQGFTLAIKTDGTLWTWGKNYVGNLGDGTIIHRSSPVQTVAGGTNWRKISAGSGGSGTSYAIRTNGTLWAWGANYAFAGTDSFLGDGTAIHRSSPVQLLGGSTDWTDISNAAYNTIGIKRNTDDLAAEGFVTREYIIDVYPSLADEFKTAGLYTWGFNSTGVLGDNTNIHRSSPVQTIAGGTNWQSIAGGHTHEAAIKTDGTLWMWGRNTSGALGTNDITHRSSPVQTIAGGTNWKFIASGGYSTAAIKTDGTLWLWGNNSFGNLGDTTRTNRSSPVQTVSTGTNWKKVSLASGNPSGQVGAVKTDGTLWTWGHNYGGVLGDNTNIHRSSPVQTISGGTNWKDIAVGGFHMSAIKTDGTLWSWGLNSGGYLGDNTLIHRSSPVQTVSGGTNWKLLSATSFGTAAIKTDGTLWLWGGNYNGQLGINSTANRSSPVQTVSTGTNWKIVAGGSQGHIGAIKTDGSLWLWGGNSYGQLGIGDRNHRSSPVQTLSGSYNWKSVALCSSSTIVIRDDSEDPI